MTSWHMVTLLDGAHMVDRHAHMDMGAKVSHYVMVIRLAGLIATGSSCLLIMNLDNKQMHSVRTLGFLRSLLVS